MPIQHTSTYGAWLARLAVCGLLVSGAWYVRAGDARPLLRDFIGINGHTVQFKPELNFASGLSSRIAGRVCGEAA